MFLKFESELKANKWVAHNDALVGYDPESDAKTRTLAKAVIGVDSNIYIGLAKERWNGEELAEPLELLEGEIVESFERIEIPG